MISVCIPIYNNFVEPLVLELARQIEDSGCVAEICLVDDASDMAFRLVNYQLTQNRLVRYIGLEQNIGRAAIRNYLAEVAAYPYLLFLDCDVQVNAGFINGYVSNMHAGQVVSGGVVYQKKEPARNRFLHWKNGSRREVVDVGVRRNNPYHTFLSCNFLVSKDLFWGIRFDDQIQGYGYEDVVLGMELAQRQISICHIHNPVVHLGIEETGAFIAKIEKSIDNLVALSTRLDPRQLSSYVKLFRFYHQMSPCFVMLVSRMFVVSRGGMRWLLHAKNPPLFVLDCYKLGYLCHRMPRNGFLLSKGC